MTESDWLGCTSRPADMLRHVRTSVLARKLQLLGCACCRLVWSYIPAEAARSVSEVESYIDGAADAPDWLTIRDNILNTYRDEITDGGDPQTPEFAGLLAAYTLTIGGLDSGDLAWLDWVQAAVSRATPDGEKQAALNRTRQQICDLFREIIGNPFRPWMVLPDFLGGGLVQPDGRTVKLTGTARQLAASIHAEQAFDRLPILADAVEESGISDADILAHLRHDGGHVRGCWALDVVLGK